MDVVSRALMLALPAGAVGCSILLGVDGLTGGFFPDDGGVAEGAVSDAGGDAVGDAALDSMTMTDAPLDGSLPCGVPHTFCDDFDDGGLGARWDMQRTVQGSLALDTTVSVSPSRSMLVTANPGDASGESYDIALYKNFSGSFSSIHCELDVMTDSAAAPQTAAAFSINVSASAGSDYLILWDIDQARLYQEFDPKLTYEPISLPTSGKWTRVAVELKLNPDAGVGLLTLWYDGTQIASVPSLGQPIPISGARFAVGLALGYAPLPNSWHTHYDNAWCDIL